MYDNIYTLIKWMLITICVIAIPFLYYFHEDVRKVVFGGQIHRPSNQTVVLIISWVALLIISYASTRQIVEIISASKNKFQKRAFFIAIMVGLVGAIIIFRQSFLDSLFPDSDSSKTLKTVLFIGSFLLGWVVWYLKRLKKYGEFFAVLLFTTVTGLSWYARLTSPDEVKLAVVALLLGLLLHIAKGYLDIADETPVEPATKTPVKAEPKTPVRAETGRIEEEFYG